MNKSLCAGCAIVLAAMVSVSTADAATFKVLYSITGGNDGEYPEAGVIRDSAGNLYGTTFEGGPDDGGAVFDLAPGGALTVLHTFGDDGYSQAPLTMDGTGNLYGATNIGTSVFKLAPDGAYTVLHAFYGGNDGINLLGGVVEDRKGNLYGTTEYGGSEACFDEGCGIVFELAPDGSEKILYSFQGGSDGKYPESGVVLKSGVLYGTTAGGGAGNAGTVFAVSRSGGETVLYAFTGANDGGNPQFATPIMDRAGNLYGTAAQGGANGCGTLYKLASDGRFTLLYTFGGSSGCRPQAGLLADAAGNLYGTTAGGGAGHGTVFKLAPDGTETVLYAFGGKNDGSNPYSTLIADKRGNLYGTTAGGGAYGVGTIFRVKN